MKRDKNAPERAQPPDPPDTPTEAPTIEPRPDCAPLSQGLEPFQIDIRKVAPDYDKWQITIRDAFGEESRHFVPSDQTLTPADLEYLFQKHVEMLHGGTDVRQTVQ